MNSDIEPSDLEGLERSEQKELMKQWFLANYEDPAERTPYESAEGGYVWIWGGPFDAQEELADYFHQYTDESVINELVEDLEEHCTEWAPTERPGDYDDYIIDDISDISEGYHNFSGAILDIEKLLETPISSDVEYTFYRLLFANVITALETYLSDSFITRVMGDKNLFNEFVKSNPDFQHHKIPLSKVTEAAESLETTVKTHLLEVVWHNLDRVSKMYHATLGVKFPDDLGDIFRAILKRHDIVHRNGRNKSGEEILVHKKEISALIEIVEKLVQEIDGQLSVNNL